MDKIDDSVKHRSIFDARLIPAGFNERSDALLEDLRAPDARIRHIRLMSALRFAAAVALIVILLAGAALAAYTLSGGDYFKQLFQNVADSGGYGYMNTEQLGNMASSTVGNVIDTDDLSVDVLGVLISGNTAQFDIKITAKKLDTVMYDTGIEPLMNYRFHDSWNLSLLEDGVKKESGLSSGTIGHIYSDTDESLAPNQFIIRYSYLSEVSLEDKTYIMTFLDFGYFDFDEPDQFVELYEGEWSFNIAFDPADDTSRTMLIGQSMSAGDFSYTIDSVCITPLSCSVSFSNAESYYDRLDERWQKVWVALCDKTENFSVNLADGTRLDRSQYQRGGAGGALGYEIIAVFNVPITVEDVVSITIGSMDISLG